MSTLQICYNCLAVGVICGSEYSDFNCLKTLILNLSSRYDIGRIWAGGRVMSIYGGTSQIMKELISRSIY